MSITAVNTWSFADEVTSAQLNEISTKLTYATDKRSGQTDSIGSVLSFTGAGRLVPTFAAGADSNTTYLISGGNNVIVTTTLTANREYTLSNTDAVEGDELTVHVDAGTTYSVTVKNAAAATLIVLGAGSTAGSRWADFRFNGSAWVLFRSSLLAQNGRTAFTVNGTYTVPPGVYSLLVLGVGGGGGGGGAGGGIATADNNDYATVGGGGGGAAQLGAMFVDTTPGTAFSVVVGTGGPGGSSTIDGTDGTATTFGTTLAFRGGQGGSKGGLTPTSSLYNCFAPGGGPTAGLPARTMLIGTGSVTALENGVAFTYPFLLQPGEGGYGAGHGASGTGVTASAAGAYSQVSGTLGGSYTTSPGAGASIGTASSGILGGGAGGGGGCNAWGNGGAGGAGGNGNGAGGGAAGTAGSAGTVGAGGGGAGGGGNGTTTGGGAANGGTGGTGALVVIPIR